MSEKPITRYTLGRSCSVDRYSRGDWVLYDDHAEALAQARRDLAATRERLHIINEQVVLRENELVKRERDLAEARGLLEAARDELANHQFVVVDEGDCWEEYNDDDVQALCRKLDAFLTRTA